MDEKDNYIKSIIDMVPKLLELVSNSCYNVISPNLLYIITEINLSVLNSFEEERAYYKKENSRKKTLDLNEALEILAKLYPDLYDVNLFLFKSQKKYTIIEIRYLLKSSFDKEYYDKIRDYKPMLHVKVAIPSYISINESKEKFDVNWQHSLIKHPIKMLLCKLRYRIENFRYLKK